MENNLRKNSLARNLTSSVLFVVFVIGFPGIVLQWIIIPYLARVLKKAGVYNG